MIRTKLPLISTLLVLFASSAHADEASPELLVSRVNDELLKDGIWLKRLGLRWELQKLADGSMLVEIIEASSENSVQIRKLKAVPESEEAAVAELTVVITQMVMELLGNPRTVQADPQAERQVEDPAKPKWLRVRIDADDPDVELHRYLGSSISSSGGLAVYVDHFERVCKAPCNRDIDPAVDGYFLTGDGISATNHFDLSSYRRAVTIKVEAGSEWLRVVGRGLTYYVGIPAVIAGGVLLGFGLAEDEGGTKVAGGATLGAGLAVGIAGLIMLVTGGTSYEILDEG